MENILKLLDQTLINIRIISLSVCIGKLFLFIKISKRLNITKENLCLGQFPLNVLNRIFTALRELSDPKNFQPWKLNSAHSTSFPGTSSKLIQYAKKKKKKRQGHP